MLRWLKALFAWEEIGKKGAWAYFENRITGERKASKAYIGHSPQDREWLAGGAWDRPAPVPPFNTITTCKRTCTGKGTCCECHGMP